MAKSMAAASEARIQDTNLQGSDFLSHTVWKLQGWGLAFLVFMSFFPRLFHMEEYVFFVLFIMALTGSVRSRSSLWARTPVDVPLLLFLMWVLGTIPFSMDPAYSFSEWRKLLVQALVFYWALLVLRRDDDRLVARVLAAVLMGTLVLSAVALTDFVSRGGTWKDRLVRAGAPSSDYNWLTTYLIIAIPLLVTMIYSARTMWARALGLMTTIVALIAQGAAYTRAGWLGMVAQGVALGMVTARRIILIWVLFGGLVFMSGFIIAAQLGYQRDTVDSLTFDSRLAVWKLAATEVLAHPIVGIGYGNSMFMKRFAAYPETDKAAGYHNVFLMMATGSGLPALALFVWLFVTIFRTLVARARSVTNTAQYVFLIAVVVAVVGFATRNSFDYMFAGSLAYLFWIVVAVGLKISESYTDSKPS